MGVYERIAALLPKPVLKAFKQELIYLAIPIDERKFVGFIFSFSIAVSLGIALNLGVFLGYPILPVFLAFVFLCLGGTYAYLVLSSDAKGRFVEKVLPDALQLIASNVSAGVTLEKALYFSARKEFGPLSVELKRASQRVVSGVPIEEALMDVTKRIRSDVLNKTFWLMAQGVRSGGEMSSLLIELSADLRQRYTLRQETKANISVYSLLIFFASTIAGPALLGISTFIVEVTAARTASFILPEVPVHTTQSAAFLAIPGKGLDPIFVADVSALIVAVGALFASLTMGVIKTGSEKDGLKYIPPVLLIALAVFYAVRLFLKTALAPLF